MTILVAITGGIGSGKSTFSKQVVKRNLELLDSDEQVANIYKKPNKDFINFLKKIKLGQSIKRGEIDKKIISGIVFNDKKTRNQLENYIFKIIRKKREVFIKKHKKQMTSIVFMDIPLLFENKLNKRFDLVISIISTRRERFKRLKKYKKMQKNMFNKIIKLQSTDIERKSKSDIVVQNNKTKGEFINKVNKILDGIIR